MPDCPKRVLVREMVGEFLRKQDTFGLCSERLDAMQKMADEILATVQPEDGQSDPLA